MATDQHLSTVNERNFQQDYHSFEILSCYANLSDSPGHQPTANAHTHGIIGALTVPRDRSTDRSVGLTKRRRR